MNECLFPHQKKSYVEAPACSITVCGERTVMEVVKVKGGHRMGPLDLKSVQAQ